MFPEELKKTINLQSVPDIVKHTVDEYKTAGYTIIPNLFSTEQVELAKKEWNYHTLSRGIDLYDPNTWDAIKGQHDWKQGWAKWLYTTGIQVLHTQRLNFA